MFFIGINRDHYAVLSYCSMVLLLHKLISYEMIESAKKAHAFFCNDSHNILCYGCYKKNCDMVDKN